MKKEKTFQSEFNKSCRALKNMHFYQIPNAPYSPNIIRRPIEKPYDCYCVHNGVFYGLELKVMGSNTFLFSKVKDHQVKYLMEVEENGGFGYLLINISLMLTDTQKEKLGLEKCRINFIYYLRITDFIKMREASNKKSIPLASIIEDYKKNENVISRKKFNEKFIGWDVGVIWK